MNNKGFGKSKMKQRIQKTMIKTSINRIKKDLLKHGTKTKLRNSLNDLNLNYSIFSSRPLIDKVEFDNRVITNIVCMPF